MHVLRALGVAALILAAPSAARAQNVPAGTPITVRLEERLSTGHVQRGTHWNGTVARPVVVRGRTVIAAGSPVDGVVTSSAEGTHHSKAHMSLAIRSVGGRSMPSARETIVADSHRAKKIGAVVAGTAAGALLGHAVAEHGHGALIGGVLGGGGTYLATRHAFRTLVLKEGTELTFTTVHPGLAARR